MKKFYDNGYFSCEVINISEKTYVHFLYINIDIKVDYPYSDNFCDYLSIYDNNNYSLIQKVDWDFYKTIEIIDYLEDEAVKSNK